MVEIGIRQPLPQEFEQIRSHAASFNLDNNDLRPDQFIVATAGGVMVGFVRLKTHIDCIELSTLGVLTEYRGKGIGEILVNSILKKSPAERIYILTVIPSYFSKLGFQVTDSIPDSLKPKKEDCRIHCCSDNVTAMVKKPS